MESVSKTISGKLLNRIELFDIYYNYCTTYKIQCLKAIYHKPSSQRGHDRRLTFVTLKLCARCKKLRCIVHELKTGFRMMTMLSHDVPSLSLQEGQSQILCKLQMRHEQSRIIHCARQRIYPTAACVQYNAGGDGCQGRRQGRRSSERRAQRRADP